MKKMDEEVRRTDLYLRSEYPHFHTRIFKLLSGWYLIYIENFGEDFEGLKNIFHNTIKPITVPVELVKELPLAYELELSSIADTEIASSFAGIPFNTRDLKNILIVKFPKLDFYHIEGNSGDNRVKIYTNPEGDGASKQGLLNFLAEIETRVPFIVIDDPEQTKAALDAEEQRRMSLEKSIAVNSNFARFNAGFDNPVLYVFPSKLNRHCIEFEQRDESFWFDNVNGIFERSVNKDSIIKQDCIKNSCYLDYAGFKNVNIRNGLVLFDMVYIELPVDRGIEFFCQEQKVTCEELLQLTKEGKIVFVLTQPYFRYDFEFLKIVYQTNPNAVLSRRAISALVLCDIVDINKNYILNDLDALDTIYELSRVFAEATQC